VRACVRCFRKPREQCIGEVRTRKSRERRRQGAFGGARWAQTGDGRTSGVAGEVCVPAVQRDEQRTGVRSPTRHGHSQSIAAPLSGTPGGDHEQVRAGTTNLRLASARRRTHIKVLVVRRKTGVVAQATRRQPTEIGGRMMTVSEGWQDRTWAARAAEHMAAAHRSHGRHTRGTIVMGTQTGSLEARMARTPREEGPARVERKADRCGWWRGASGPRCL